jgi:hypothetical protein
MTCTLGKPVYARQRDATYPQTATRDSALTTVMHAPQSVSAWLTPICLKSTRSSNSAEAYQIGAGERTARLLKTPTGRQATQIEWCPANG